MNYLSKITVFTPTYNRGECLNVLYNSLVKQTNKKFEWIIVDDGSTDKTEDIVKKFLFNNNAFEIRYFKVKNGGKHRAINKGIKYANGFLFMIVDSDDYLDPNAIKIIYNVEKTIHENSNSKFCGVCGLRCNFNKKIIGSSFSGKFLDITNLERNKYSISGDKAEVFYTEILKKYPFPEFDGENFLTEAVVWNRMANDGYKMRYFNDPIYYCEYRKDGLTCNINDITISSPIGQSLYIREMIIFSNFNKIKKIRTYYSYFSLFRKQYKFSEISSFLEIKSFKLLLLVFINKCIDFFKKIIMSISLKLKD